MINTQMRSYNYFTFGEKDAYGQFRLSEEPVGTIRMAINDVSTTIGDTIKYKNATYTGLTQDAKVNDTYVIEYEGQKLKVLYVNSKGRLSQVFMAEV
jgi:hypothetical protein